MPNQTTLIQLPLALQNDPAWYAARRAEALAKYATLAIPGRENEDWRRTDTKFNPDAYAPYTPAGVALPGEISALIADGPVMVQHNSEIVLERLSDDLAAKGVIFCSLQTAIEKHADLVQKYLFGRCFDPFEHKLSAQHAAYLSGGVFVYIPKDVEVTEPLQIFTWADAAGAGVFNHILVVAERFSKVTINEWLGSAEGADILQNGGVEIYTGDGAKVDYFALQTMGSKTRALNPRRAQVGRDASVSWYHGDFGGGKTRADQISYMDGDGGHSEAFLLFFGSGDQHMDIGTSMLHTKGQQASSNIVARGVMTDSARAVFRGTGHIMHGAKNCSTYQSEKALLLTEEAHHDTIPGLFIDESDVTGAGHGATVGQLDQNQVFYLMSRGLSRTQAQQMIVTGFMAPVMDRITSGAVRTQLEELVNRKLGVS